MTLKTNDKTEYRSDIILASGSPRRREMFARKGIPVEILPSQIEENIPLVMDPATTAMYLAFAKATDVASKKPGLVIAADTIVVYEGRIMGKPADADEAFRVLSELRGNVHQVITGVCIIDSAGAGVGDGAPASRGDGSPASRGDGSPASRGDGAPASRGDGAPVKLCLYDVSDVFLDGYSDEELRAYTATDEPYDKAGGYAVQESFGKYTKKIEGDRDNVIGFPMYRVEEYLKVKRIVERKK